MLDFALEGHTLQSKMAPLKPCILNIFSTLLHKKSFSHVFSDILIVEKFIYGIGENFEIQDGCKNRF